MWTSSARNTVSKPPNSRQRDGRVLPAAPTTLFPINAPLRRPVLLGGLAGLWCALFCAAAGAAACGTVRLDDHAHVAYVYDGDTVRLDDGRHVRLIGINAPEIGHHGERSQPFAVAARRALIRVLAAHGDRIGLRYDRDHYDKYHRVLAHLYVDQDQSVEAWLLSRGLATLLIVPPDVGNVSCYQAAERVARAQRRGIWRDPAYQVTPVEHLDRHSRGYHIIRGRVSRIGHGGRALWLQLGPTVALRIDRRDLAYLRPLTPDALLHREVVARGWLHAHRRGGGLWMRIRHHTALRVIH